MILEGAGEQPQPQTKQAEITAILTVQPLHPLIGHGTDAQIDDPHIRQTGGDQQPTQPIGVAEMAFMDLKAATFQVREIGSWYCVSQSARMLTGPYCFSVIQAGVTASNSPRGGPRSPMWNWAPQALSRRLEAVRQTYCHSPRRRSACSSVPSNSPSPKKVTFAPCGMIEWTWASNS